SSWPIAHSRGSWARTGPGRWKSSRSCGGPRLSRCFVPAFRCGNGRDFIQYRDGAQGSQHNHRRPRRSVLIFSGREEEKRRNERKKERKKKRKRKGLHDGSDISANDRGELTKQ